MKITYLSVVSLIDLGWELEVREGVAGGQLVVERQQAVGLQTDGACWREVVHMGIQSAIMADGRTQEECPMGVWGQGAYRLLGTCHGHAGVRQVTSMAGP